VVESNEKPMPAPTQVNLKDPVLAAFLAWLIPGAGHFYQGRHAKGVLFLVCILGTFLFGLILGRGQCVYAQWEPASMRRYSYLCQLGAGLPALPALVGAYRSKSGNPDETLPFLSKRWYMPPRFTQDPMGGISYNELDEWYAKYSRDFELGTVFTMIAGLLNILAIYDAWGGPAFGGAPARRKEEKPAEAAAVE
jgi:TM2 domain-containing membrane protein YozV